MAKRIQFGRLAAAKRGAIVILLGLEVTRCAPSISGTLLDAQDQAIYNPAARVNAVSLSANGASQVVSLNSDGTFAIKEHLKPGAYLIEALVPGYYIASTKCDLQRSSSIVLKLKKIPNSSKTTFDANATLQQEFGAGNATLAPPQL